MVSPRELADAYARRYPSEGQQTDSAPFKNWLARLATDPNRALATQNWSGKVTLSLFDAAGVCCPKTKREMLVLIGGVQ